MNTWVLACAMVSSMLSIILLPVVVSSMLSIILLPVVVRVELEKWRGRPFYVLNLYTKLSEKCSDAPHVPPSTKTFRGFCWSTGTETRTDPQKSSRFWIPDLLPTGTEVPGTVVFGQTCAFYVLFSLAAFLGWLGNHEWKLMNENSNIYVGDRDNSFFGAVRQTMPWDETETKNI